MSNAWFRFRVRLGAWLIGDRFFDHLLFFVQIFQLARRAVHEDGTVTLSECEPLADALYRQPVGEWELSVERRRRTP